MCVYYVIDNILYAYCTGTSRSVVSAAKVETPMGNTESLSVTSCTECRGPVTAKGRISSNAEIRCNK